LRVAEVRLAVIWHDLECGAYAADLPLWEELADRAGGPVLELGAGTGRVALHLARRGHSVTAVELVPELTEELARRASASGLDVNPVAGDVRALALGRRYPLVLAPMQLLQLLHPQDRPACLRSIAGHLSPDGRAAIAIVERTHRGEGDSPLPDLREVEGWVCSSQPLAIRPSEEGLSVIRRRQTVSPDGTMSQEDDEVFLHALPLETLESESVAAGLRLAETTEIQPSDEHVGSTVALLEAA
jgi:SAM-dependent methyltransferase